MKIFVTGATGFIGSHLVRQLLEDPKFSSAQVYCFVRDARKISLDLKDRIQILEGSVETLSKYETQIKDSEYIFHIAACAALTDGNYQTDNVEFTTRLAAIAEKSSNLKRFVFTSSIAAADRTPEDDCLEPITESSKPNPLSDYGKSKLHCEILLQNSKLPYTIIRPTWVYGPGMRPKSHIRFFIQAVASKKPFTLFNFPGKVSIIHVHDLVRSIVLSAQHSSAEKQVYFAANAQSVSLGEIFKLIGRTIGRAESGKIPVNFLTPYVRRIRQKLSLQVQNLFCDVLSASAKKLEAIGFKCEIDPFDGFLETAHWHFNQEKAVSNQWAVVTGGAGGIGRAVAEQLYGRGHKVAIIDVDQKAGEDLARRIDAQFLAADLSTDEGRLKAENLLKNKGTEITVWINNAGIGRRGHFVDIPAEECEKVYQLNCVTPMVLSRAVLNEFKSKGEGTLVNVASSAAFQPLPYMAVYAASKSFLASFSLALENEVRRTAKNIRVLTVFPGGTATNFQKNAGVSENDRHELLDSYSVASRIIKLIRKESRQSIIGLPANMMFLFSKCLPIRYQGMVWEKMMREYR